MSTIKNVNINGIVSKLSAGVYDVSEQNSDRHFTGISEVLANANAYIPENDRFPGMQIKFIQDTEPSFSVVRTDNITEQPSGTSLENTTSIQSGTYKESELTIVFATLPQITGYANAVTYYFANTVDETTTYVSWLITKISNNSVEYVQYRLMSADWSSNVTDWQGVDEEITQDSQNLVKSGSVMEQMTNIMDMFPGVVVDSYSSADFGITMDGTYGSNKNYKHGCLEVASGEKYVLCAHEQYFLRYAFGTSAVVVGGSPMPLVYGTTVHELSAGEKTIVNIPQTCTHLLLYNEYRVADIFNIKKIRNFSGIKKIIGARTNIYNRKYILINGLTIYYDDDRIETVTFQNAQPIVMNDSTRHIIVLRKNNETHSVVKLQNASELLPSDAILLDFLNYSNNSDPIIRNGLVSDGFIKDEYYTAITYSVVYNISTIGENDLYDPETKILSINNLYITFDNTLQKVIQVYDYFRFDTEHTKLIYDTVSSSVKFLENEISYVLLLQCNSKMNFVNGVLLGEINAFLIRKYKTLNKPLYKALSDNYGTMLTETETIDCKIDGTGALITNPRYGHATKKYVVSGGEYYYILSNVNSDGGAEYAFYNDSSVLSVGYYHDNIFRDYSIVKAPSDATILYVPGTNNFPADCRLIDVDGTSLLLKTITITPLLTYDIIRSSDGDFSTNTNFTSGSYKSTPRFIKAPNVFNISSSIAGDVNVYSYGNDFSFISAQTVSVSVDTSVPVYLPTATYYIKIMQNTGNKNVPNITLTGNFTDDWDIFNPIPTDSGYHRISVLVNVTNPNCCDAVETYNTDDISDPNRHLIAQDTTELLPDYGVICLPDTYMNTGEPTRLIIYCHGGAVNYSSSATRFDTQDLEPEYWLKEGYAVMDIEGNPFDNSNEHFHIPQAMDCYIAAYKWSIEHYNIKRDGVFLGGRSLGGGMTFNLTRAQCPIPVIAACPNAPHGMCAGGTIPAGTTNARQKFYAEHCGFNIPEGFDWNTTYYNGTTYTDGSKKKLFFDNWDKLAKNTPIWSMCTDLPTSEESKRELVDNFYVSGTGHPSQRNVLWGKLHAMARCPVKLFGCYEDESCPPDDTVLLYYRMLTNAAQIAEVRLFHSYKNYSGTGTTAHHYDTQDPALRTNVTTRFGVEMTNVPIVYVEMLQFWRRYEQGN